MSGRRRAGTGIASLAALAAVGLLAGWLHSARAQARLWAIDADACTTDGTRCIKGIVKTSPPFFATAQECDKKLQQVARQYHQANLNVQYIRCVQLH